MSDFSLKDTIQGLGVACAPPSVDAEQHDGGSLVRIFTGGGRGARRETQNPLPIPLKSEGGTYKAVKARFWP